MRALLLVVVAGCGADEATIERIRDSPDASRALALTQDARVVVIGGPNAFGLMRLQHRRADGRWITTDDTPSFDANARLVGGRGVPLYAIAETAAYRLDEVTMTWTSLVVPPGATPGTVFGVDAEARLYAVDHATGVGDGAIVRWTPGTARWIDVEGTRAAGVIEAPAVAPTGEVAWFSPGEGIVRAVDGVFETVEACADCAGSRVAYDASARLTTLVCPAIRRDGRQVDIAAAATCGPLDVAASGDTLVTSFDASGGGSVWTSPAGSLALSRLAPADTSLTYVIASSDLVYAWADGIVERGVFALAR